MENGRLLKDNQPTHSRYLLLLLGIGAPFEMRTAPRGRFDGAAGCGV